MTHEEILATAETYDTEAACFDRDPAEVFAFAQGYRALSAKLQAAESGCVHLREARQVDLDMLAKMDDEHVALSAKLQEAEQDRDIARIAAAEWRTKLTTKTVELQEVQAERDVMAKDLAWYHKQRDELLSTASRGLAVHLSEFNDKWNKMAMGISDDDVPASRGEVVKACPRWQLIEAAPKDGTEILLTDGHYKRTGYWAKRIEGWTVDAVVPLNMPTHWMPLPALWQLLTPSRP